MRLALTDFLHEEEDFLVSIFAKAMGTTERVSSTYEPDIPYEERYSVWKFVLRLIPLGIIAVASSAFFGLFSGHIFITLATVVVMWGLAIAARAFISHQLEQMNGRHSRKYTLLWLVLILGLGSAGSLTLHLHQVDFVLSLGYLIFSVIVGYFILREQYKWGMLLLYREEAQLKAYRPRSDVYFLKPVDESLDLSKVDNYSIKSNWLESRIGIDKISIDAPGEKDEYWNTLTFIKNVQQLTSMLNQTKMRNGGW